MSGPEMSLDLNRAVFSIVDTLDLPLEKKGAKITGHGVKTTKAKCGLEVDWPVRVSSDFVGETDCGILVHFRKNLWGYVYASGSAPGGGKNPQYPLWVAMFDGGEQNFASLRKGNAKTFIIDNLAVIKAAFRYEKNRWEAVDPASLAR